MAQSSVLWRWVDRACLVLVALVVFVGLALWQEYSGLRFPFAALLVLALWGRSWLRRRSLAGEAGHGDG